MKRIIKLVILLLLIVPIKTSSTITGDIDGNGKVDSQDYLKVKKHILKLYTLTGDYLKRADVDGNGKVESLDALKIKKIVLGINTSTSNVVAESITLDKTDLIVYKGDSETLTATISPSNANKNITWTSSNPIVAVVDNGVITAKKVGKTIITAEINNKKAKAVVEVKEAVNRIHFVKQASSSEAALLGGYDVGDAIILESNGHYAMIDTGLDDEIDNKYILDYLKAIGVNKLDFVLITHAHTDHMGGLPYLINKLPISKIYYKTYLGSGGSQDLVNRVEQAARKNNVSITYIDKAFKDGDSISLKKMEIHLYNTKQNTYKTVHYDRNNNIIENSVNADSNSVLELINIAEYKILLTGDLSDEEHNISYLNELAHKSEFRNLTLLKMPNHGYKRSAFGGIKDETYNKTFSMLYPSNVIVTNSVCDICRLIGAKRNVYYVNSRRATIFNFDEVFSVSTTG